jgi:hypothetical protein
MRRGTRGFKFRSSQKALLKLKDVRKVKRLLLSHISLLYEHIYAIILIFELDILKTLNRNFINFPETVVPLVTKTHLLIKWLQQMRQRISLH